MKKLVNVALAALFLLALTGAASAQTVDIDDIQVYNLDGTPDATATYYGQVVTVEGKITSPKGVYNTGTHYIQDDTGGVGFYDTSTAGYTFVYGDRVQITGTVGAYSGEIQLQPPFNFVPMGLETEYDPAILGIDAVLADYESVGSLIGVIGTVVEKNWTSPTASGDFKLFVGTDTILVYIDKDTGIDLGTMADGDEYLASGICVSYNGLIELKPRRQSDIIENPLGDTAPIIDGVFCDNWTPEASDVVTVSATITDDAGITSAMLYYRDDAGDSTGIFNSVAMANVGGNLWSGTIPATHTGVQIDYYVQATDTAAQTVNNPGAAPGGWYEIAVGFTPIYDVQYAHPDSLSQSSSYYGKVVNVRGVVTAGTGDAGTVSKFIMQDGEGQFSGLLVYDGSGAYGSVYQGDLVEVGGYIDEYYGLTEMAPHSSAGSAAVNIVSYNNTMPRAAKVATRYLRDDTLEDGDSVYGEAYESVWVRTVISTVMDTLGYGEYIISDTHVRADSVCVDPNIELTYQPTIGDFVSVTGFMDYEYGDFQITPYRDDHVLAPITGIGDELPSVLPAGGLQSIAPNPFNPQTEIKFVLTRSNLAQLNIYNIKGEMITSLHNGTLEAGEYAMTWDGRNSAGQQLASGTYFARLRIGSEVYQVRKLSLVK